MPPSKTDWKKIRALIQDQPDQNLREVPGPGDPKKGVTMLEKGTRQSTNNDVGGKADSMEELMRMWYENQQGRGKNKKRMPFKGLFGGGE